MDAWSVPGSQGVSKPLIAHYGVLNGHGERVTYMELPRYVGRGHHYRKRRFTAVYVRRKIALFLPVFVKFGLELFGIECLVHNNLLYHR